MALAARALYTLFVAGAVVANDITTTGAVEAWSGSLDPLILPRGRSVNQIIGPETAVYCKLTDPTARVVFDGLGRCNLILDRVGNDHAGTWTMTVGLQGSMLTRDYTVTAQVRGLDDKPTVTTTVAKEQPEVTLSCSVPVEYEVKSCVFQDPSGRAIVASEGVSEDRYIFHGAGTTVNAGVTTHECGLRITSTETSDLGLWRCAVQTDHETYYGFLEILCPWAMQDPATAAAVVSEPTLTSLEEIVRGLEGGSMTLSCNIQSAIRYCYFRASNGTVFNVAPGLSSDNFEYVGAGLDAGECGIRFSRMLPSDTGRWSCHVGLPDTTQPEQRVEIVARIRPTIELQQYVTESGLLRVEGVVFKNQTAEYCRYVRMDGLGFSSATLPDSRYTSIENLDRGLCAIEIANPTVLEMHPWTVVAKMVGMEDEFSGVTDHTIQMPETPGASNTLVLPRGRSVNQIIGPKEAVYCKLTDHSGGVVFDGLGRCNLVLNRVGNNHAGTWAMTVGLPGSILTTEQYIIVQVRGSDDKPTVTTHVAKERPIVTLSCSVPVEYEVTSCVFQDPSGRAIVASEGVSEDRYTFHGAGTTIDASVTTHECGLRITDPVTADLGLWRCAVQTDHETYYGFLEVLCPWAMQDPATAAAVISEPTLTAPQEIIRALEGDSFTMTCNIQSAIRYCFFRASNGTVFNVSPGLTSDHFEYVGAGLDAGECGIRFSRMLPSDTGRWSCHVGLPDLTQPEQRVEIVARIRPTIELKQYVTDRGLLRVEGEVFKNQTAEYCRYVRMDGLGFSSATLPDSRYTSEENLVRGLCAFEIANPTILEMHPWIVVAKMVGMEEEFSGVTDHTLELPGSPGSAGTTNILLWCLVALVSVLLCVTGFLLIPPKHRRNTIARANSWRESFQKKKVPLPADVEIRSTPMSA